MVADCGALLRNIRWVMRYKCYDLQCHKARRTMTSIVPYKSFVGLRQSIYVSPRRDGAAGTLQIRSIPCSTSNS